jgi:hypothetical protein
LGQSGFLKSPGTGCLSKPTGFGLFWLAVECIFEVKQQRAQAILEKEKSTRRQQHRGQLGPGKNEAREFNCAASRCGLLLKAYSMLRMPVMQERACFNDTWKKACPAVRLSKDLFILVNVRLPPCSGTSTRFQIQTVLKTKLIL